MRANPQIIPICFLPPTSCLFSYVHFMLFFSFYVPLNIYIIANKDRRREKERNIYKEGNIDGLLLACPLLGSSWHLGMCCDRESKPVTFWCMRQHSTDWATQARAVLCFSVTCGQRVSTSTLWDFPWNIRQLSLPSLRDILSPLAKPWKIVGGILFVILAPLFSFLSNFIYFFPNGLIALML